MQISAYEMDKPAATEKWREVCANIRNTKNVSEYDKVLKRCYYAMSQGQKVIDIVQVMRGAGCNHLGEPRLAIMPADAKTCILDREMRGGGLFRRVGSNRNRSRVGEVSLPQGTFVGWAHVTKWQELRDLSSLRTSVPSIPADIAEDKNLSRYHVLWEVDQWTPMPPKDPLLLRRLGKTMFAILAEWELTDLEYAVTISASL